MFSFCSSKPEEFKKSLHKYVEARSSGQEGGQFWPLVKQVKMFVPRCDVCRMGVKLVDLPGTRDSNAARNQMARDVSTCATLQKFRIARLLRDEKKQTDRNSFSI